MDKLWAPWRMQYITQKNTKGCLFCRINKQNNDRKNLILIRSKHCLVVLNKFPYNNGHLMVVPIRHIADLSKLKTLEIVDIHKTISTVLSLLKKALKPDGFNIGLNLGRASGAGIDKHIHYHIVPRWIGDTNFMPVTSDTKIVSQSLEALYKLLKKYEKR